MQKYLDAQTEAIRVTLIGMVLDLALGVGKIIGGIFTSSFALVADGVHSLTDAARTSLFLLSPAPPMQRPIEGIPTGMAASKLSALS